MGDSLINEIMNSYGYKGSEPQYKTINYPVVPKYQNLEDHIEQPQSQMLQQILDEKKKREMVEVYGITLKRTKQFYAEKIKEYNDLIDLKHLTTKRRTSEQPKQKRDNMIRFPGDDGKITNFHISINSQNLNPLFAELTKREIRQSSLQQDKLKIKDSMDQSQVINSIKLISNSQKISRVPTNKTSKLEEKLILYDKQNFNMNESITIDEIQKTNDQSTFIDRNINHRRSTIKKNTRPPFNSEEPKSKISERISESIKQSFNCVNEKLTHSTSEDNLDIRLKQLNKTMNLDMTQIVQPESTLFPSHDNSIDRTQIFPDIYKDIRLDQQINFEKRKINLQRRKSLISNILNRRNPKFLHICGSKFSVPNNEQNWNDYKSLKVRLLEKQLQNEMEKLRNQKQKDDELYDLSVLQGPPKYVKYQSTNLKQDYTDIKVTKILQKLAQTRDP